MLLALNTFVYAAQEMEIDPLHRALIAQGYKILPGEQMNEEDEEGEYPGYKFPLFAHKALQAGKIEVIKNRLKNLATSSDNKSIRKFILTIFEDLQKINLSNHEEIVEKLNQISKNLNGISQAANISQEDVTTINDIQSKINSLISTNIKTLDLSKLQVEGEEKIDLNETEPLTQETFLELITQQNRKNQPYILTRVETDINGQKVLHYFDAHELNKFIFNNYPIFPQQGKWSVEEGTDTIKHKKGVFGINTAENPLNRQPLKANNINYFILDSLKDNQFKYLASFKDIINNEYEDLIPFFYKNYGLLQPQLIHTLNHNVQVNAVAISSNGQLVASGDQSGIGKIWNANNGSLIKNLDLKRPIRSIKISPNNELIAFITRYYVLIYNLTNNQSYYISELDNNSYGGNDPEQPFARIEGNPRPIPYAAINSIEFSPNSEYIAYSHHREGKVINSINKELKYTFKPAYGFFTGFKISSDGRFLLTLGEEDAGDYAHIRDFANGEWDAAEESGFGPSVYNIEITKNNQYAVTIDPLKIWDFNPSKLLHNLNHIGVKSFGITPNNKFVISGTETGEIKVWNIITGELLKTLRHNGELNGIIISNNSEFFISYGDHLIQIWNIKTRKDMGALIYEGKINSIALNPNDTNFVVGSNDNTAKVWKI